ncbi:NUDIX hydrolase N-terminal domain-containing protein [Oceanirhabdus sp. W0125-5]|uniref:NUDIX hydrolase N-terminal domain-containing protein n=1 Tax=Oceanirhabdus sp. W0125-5 TaxID=2999116 RepID=UPI0022F2BF1C|nr:NUDIX hydrolase N-terminal domain-containing protein [Oceanirhabdus sp. W0125-5]WBW97025.1 NUDIX hydrolase N-terminal domain-containing protein [Oceanirhabdus sp. W0125-5]
MKNILELLDEVRSIAQLGLCYAENEYDRLRYELGYITPKVGVNGVVFNKEGKILLERRVDDNSWAIPGGWAEIGESPQESVKREIYEETGLNVEVKEIIDIFTRLPGECGQPHTTYHILFHCEVIDGNLKTSFESTEVGFYDYHEIEEWHKDHFKMVKKAYEFLNG